MNKALRFIKNHTILYLMVKKPAKIVLGFPQILKIVKEESYFPEQERKSYLVRLIDNIIWLLKYREANRFYNLYGLDVRDRQNNEYIDYLSFMRSRDRNYKKENPWENQLVLLRDKFLFFKYMNAVMSRFPDKLTGVFPPAYSLYNLLGLKFLIDQHRLCVALFHY